MKNDKRNRTSYIIIALLILVVGISIGYAALSTTLNINGSSTITKQSWDVHFANIIETDGSVTATSPAAITAGDPTKVTYNITLAKPGDFYEFSVDVVNAGTLPAKISAAPSLEGVSAAQDVYVNYTVKWADSNAQPAANDLLSANGGKKTAIVRIEYDKNTTADQLPTTGETLTLSFSMNFIQG